MYCSNCDLQFKPGEVFCANCGQRLIQNPSSGQQNIQNTVGAFPDQQKIFGSKGKLKREFNLPKPSKKTAIISAGTALTLIAAVIGGSIYNQKNAEKMAKQNIEEAFSEETRAKFYVPCESFNLFIEDSKYAFASTTADKSRTITDARQALAYTQQNSVAKSSYASELTLEVEGAASAKITQMFENSKRDEKASDSQIAGWKTQWLALNLEKCGLTDGYANLVAAMKSADAEFNRINNLADSAPWYPDGFNEFNSELAWRWVHDGSDPCGYSECTYWTVDVIAKSGCSSIYLTMGVLDSGTIIDDLIDSSSYVGAGDKVRLNLIKYGGYGNSVEGQIQSISCY